MKKTDIHIQIPTKDKLNQGTQQKPQVYPERRTPTNNQ
jgi:hypothetical protein